MAQPQQQHDDEFTHVVPASLYVGIWATLMVLTLTTVLASFAELGAFNIVVALLIATIKGTLVVLFFMHLRYSPKLTIAAVIAALFWLFIMFSLTMTDYLSRGWATYAGR
ncbi:MAG: cytochrome C oxidase subunit IV family protein [Candidatus Korobacteraceae bacterium]